MFAISTKCNWKYILQNNDIFAGGLYRQSLVDTCAEVITVDQIFVQQLDSHWHVYFTTASNIIQVLQLLASIMFVPVVKHFIKNSSLTTSLTEQRSEKWRRILAAPPRADTYLPRNNVSFPDVDVDGVQRGWQEQILTLTVKRLTLESKTQTTRGTL